MVGMNLNHKFHYLFYFHARSLFNIFCGDGIFVDEDRAMGYFLSLSY